MSTSTSAGPSTASAAATAEPNLSVLCTRSNGMPTRAVVSVLVTTGVEKIWTAAPALNYRVQSSPTFPGRAELSVVSQATIENTGAAPAIKVVVHCRFPAGGLLDVHVDLPASLHTVVKAAEGDSYTVRVDQLLGKERFVVSALVAASTTTKTYFRLCTPRSGMFNLCRMR